MTRLPTHVSALALMTIDLSHLYRPTRPPRGRFDHLVVCGYGLLSHRVRADGRLTFALDTCAIGAGTSERELANSLEDDLADVGVLAAYDLQATALPLLLSVTKPGEHLSIAALASAPPSRLCDLAQRTWAKTLVPFEQACERAGIETVPASAIVTQTLWSFAVTEHMTAILSRNAIATWRLWLAHHVDVSGHWQTCAAASAQLDFWLEQNPLPVFDRHGRRLPTSQPAQNACVNGHRSFPDCGRLKFPGLAAGLISVISRYGDRRVPLSAAGRVVWGRREGLRCDWRAGFRG